ncbi:hypothetical protein SAMN02910447_00077 [Ruminococcus sp. YE71]|uniref:hypothetical protein n=1 Tax=unclassified Ruminococcus TaxID=2608920 RepID=UPI0008927A96|nr:MULTISPECIES: hypothetical protein [unclassified Ruminococcus]SDA10179.1 hypothetical protein SAMN02910446_00272 [Ruminococcus sp. YE78]SFW11033.1 hypothetical protein SAMN02910447_00077 [Ruminococcus sp. YE71]
MRYICHRINESSALKDISEELGAEIDLRDDLNGRIYLEHDPFKGGEDLEEYLRSYHHGLLILNIKSERIEWKALELVKKAGVKDYFFLDSTFPMIALLAQNGISDIALRFSEYEGIDTIRNMAGKVRWIWADCFTKCALTAENFAEFKKLGYNVCIVSPELQGRPEDIESDAKYLQEQNIIPDAICTKSYNIPIWQKYFG